MPDYRTSWWCGLIQSNCNFCRTLEIEAVFLEPGVLLTTYGMVQHNTELFCSSPLGEQQDEGASLQNSPLWDFLILDEV